MKLKYILIMMLLLLPIATAYTEVQYSLDNTTWTDYSALNNNTLTMEEFNNGIDCDTTYYIRAHHVYDGGTSNWTYQDAKTEGCGVNKMEIAAIIALTGFGILFIIVGVAMLWFKRTKK